MVIDRRRTRSDEALRVFTHSEIEEIVDMAHKWFMEHASYDGNLDEEFVMECYAESVYRFLMKKGKIKND